MGERVLLITIEAMDIALVRQGVKEGWLPTIAGLLQDGAGVRLAHAPDLFPGSGWTTMFTGRPVQDHLLMFDRQLAPGTNRVEDVDGSRARKPVLWHYLSEAGLRSTIVSIHGGYRLEPFNGTQVGWGTGDPISAKFGQPWSSPPEVLDWLESECPGRHFGFMDRLPRSTSDYRHYIDDVCRQIRLQADGLALLMDRTEWDFFCGNFYEPHQAGHLLWHLQNGGAVADLREPMRRVYQEADAAAGRLVDRCGDDVRKFVMTSTGMTENHPTCGATRSFLLEGGWMTMAEKAAAGEERRLVLATRAREALHKVTPLALRRALSVFAPDAHARMVTAGPLLGVDWPTTRAFPLPNDDTSAIRFNVAGREPEGIVEPGGGYERLAADIAAAVDELVDADSGAPAARQVHRVDDVVGAAIGDVLPDLVVEWARLPIAALDGPHTGRIPVPHDLRTGTHRPEGFFIGTGPGIVHRGDGLDSAHTFGLLDLAPTLLRAMGLPVPSELTGRPISALLPTA